MFFKQAGAIAAVSWPGVSWAREIASPGITEVVPVTVAAAVAQTKDIVLENKELLLVIAENGQAQSLIHKPSGQECLAMGMDVPMFTATQCRPYDNELQLAYPAKVTSFPAEAVRRNGDRLVVTFAHVGFEATIGLKITESYIGLRSRSWSIGRVPFSAKAEGSCRRDTVHSTPRSRPEEPWRLA